MRVSNPIFSPHFLPSLAPRFTSLYFLIPSASRPCHGDERGHVGTPRGNVEHSRARTPRLVASGRATNACFTCTTSVASCRVVCSTVEYILRYHISAYTFLRLRVSLCSRALSFSLSRVAVSAHSRISRRVLRFSFFRGIPVAELKPNRAIVDRG